MDSPQSREEIMESAKNKIENGECDDAVTMLDQLPSKTDESKKLQGWGLLCTAGATIDKVSRSLFTYSSTANNLIIVGKLANLLIPTDLGREAKIDSAVSVFATMENQDEAKLNQSIAQVVKAATILARQSRDGIHVGKVEMVASTTACTNCATAGANPNCGIGIPAGDAAALTTALTGASTLLNGLTQFGSIQALIQALGAGATGANVTRCFAANSLMEN